MAADPGRLTAHFHVDEFMRGGGCEELPANARAALAFLCRFYLEPLRQTFGAVTIHSGCRSQAHNRAVGGAPVSYHRYSIRRGRVAADVTCLTGRPSQWFDRLDALYPPVGGLIQYADHVHLDNRAGVRWRDRNGGR